MKFYYGEQVPFTILDKTLYWKIQELEHISLIKRIMSHIHYEQVRHIKHWEDALDTTYRHIHRFIESAASSNDQFSSYLYKQVLELIEFCLQESVSFIQFCRQIKINNNNIENNLVINELIDHIICQSDYFIGFAQTVLYKKN